jgi:growth factor-regulated tyrosine kinase substrate
MSKADFDKLLNQATTSGNVEPDWASILSLCDLLKRGDKDSISAKMAITAIRQKIMDKSQVVSLNALLVLEACMKNCGFRIHQEVCDRRILNDLRELARGGSSTTVKEKVTELIGTWHHALGSNPVYKDLQETYNLMKLEGRGF